MQRNDLDVAIAWREASDRIFGHYVGSSPGQYVITGTGVDGERRYLIGERVSDELWNHLGAMA